MTTTSRKLVRWTPRLAGLVVAGFLALFALDAFDGRSLTETLPAFAMHLIPSLIVLAVVALAWRFEWFGATAFIILAVLYAIMVRGRLDWIVAISGPLVIVAVLFLVSWRQQANRVV
jgi:hypothetical protein